MWTRLLSRWRVFGLFPLKNSSCKNVNNGVFFSTPVSLSSKPKFLWKSENHKSVNLLNCGQQSQDQAWDETFTLPFHSSLQEHLFIARILLFKQSLKPTDLKLPSRLELHREEPTESLDDENETWKGKLCSSVLKKRRSKMNKHKYRKRRKKFKFLRRALGK